MNGKIRDQDKSVLRDTLRKASEVRLKQYLDQPEITVETVKEQGTLIFGFWMSLILIFGPEFQITFKVHYNTKSIQKMSRNALPNNSSSDVVADFVKEYCNLVAGLIKSYFESIHVPSGVSLPLVSRGFDDVFSIHQLMSDSILDIWTLSCQEESITCIASCDIYDHSVFSKILTTPLDPDFQNSSNIEFL